MLRRWSRVRVQAELGALAASAERAEAALACVRPERAWALTRQLDAARFLLVAVAIAAIAAFGALATGSL